MAGQQPMERSKIENSIIEIFNDVFEIKDIVINDELSQKDIGDWDSIGHVRLMAAIQDEFNIDIPFEDTINLSTVRDIIDCVCQIMNSL
jgi:acyl carrier protein